MTKRLPWLVIALTVATMIVLLLWVRSSPPLETLITVDIEIGVVTLGTLIALFLHLEGVIRDSIEHLEVSIKDSIEKGMDRVIEAISESQKGVVRIEKTRWAFAETFV